MYALSADGTLQPLGEPVIIGEIGLNAEVWDVEGTRYIDFAAGIAVVNTGHRHPKVMAAVEKAFGELAAGKKKGPAPEEPPAQPAGAPEQPPAALSRS